MNGWKRKLLNKAGRVTLARSVLSSIPSYYMQVAWLPESVCNDIDRLIRNFVWKDYNGKGINLVKWRQVAQPRNSGGLGIRSARHMNIALLGKLVAELVAESRAPWAQLIRNRYGCKELIFPPRHGYCSPTYRAISKASHYLLDGFDFKIGNGKCNFWYSPWLNKVPIAAIIPFVHIADSRLRVVDVFSNGIWATNQLYSLIDEAIRQDLREFGPLLVHQSGKDRWCWGGQRMENILLKRGTAGSFLGRTTFNMAGTGFGAFNARKRYAS